MASEAFIAGKDAALANKQRSDNPYICGLTKLTKPVVIGKKDGSVFKRREPLLRRKSRKLGALLT